MDFLVMEKLISLQKLDFVKAAGIAIPLSGLQQHLLQAKDKKKKEKKRS